MSTRLSCALCGKPLSAVEMIGRENRTTRQHVGWHLNCYAEDSAASAAWPMLVLEVESRGPRRIGEIEEGA